MKLKRDWSPIVDDAIGFLIESNCTLDSEDFGNFF